jgi:hypothetical protein
MINLDNYFDLVISSQTPEQLSTFFGYIAIKQKLGDDGIAYLMERYNAATKQDQTEPVSEPEPDRVEPANDTGVLQNFRGRRSARNPG